VLTAQTFRETTTALSECRDGRKATFYCSLMVVVRGLSIVLWETVGKHLKKHWVSLKKPRKVLDEHVSCGGSTVSLEF